MAQQLEHAPKSYPELRLRKPDPNHFSFVFPSHAWQQKETPAAMSTILDITRSLGLDIVTINLPAPQNETSVQISAQLRAFQQKVEGDGMHFFYAGPGEFYEQPQEEFQKPAVVVRVGDDGRGEIVRATQRIVAEGLSENEIDEESIYQHLDIPQLPDPFAVISIGQGEPTSVRLQGYYTWRGAYAEFATIPQVTQDLVKAAIAQCRDREQKFGGLPQESS